MMKTDGELMIMWHHAGNGNHTPYKNGDSRDGLMLGIAMLDLG